MRATEFITEKWTKKYKKSINCSHPKGFSQKAHCAGRKARRAGKKTKSSSVSEETIKLSGFGPSEKSKEFVAKVNSMYPESPLNPNYRIIIYGEGQDMQIVQFELVPKSNDKVEVKWIQATPLRSGAGTKAMRELQDLARQAGIKLTLYAWDKGQVSQAKLMKFYKKQGFTPIGKSGNMEWEPNGS